MRIDNRVAMPVTSEPEALTKGRRKAAGKRWSAGSTVEWVGAGGLGLGRTKTAQEAPAGTVKAKVHYRLDGSSRKATFTPADIRVVDQVKAFQSLLDAAYINDWPANDKHRPIPPFDLPAVVEATDEADDIEAATSRSNELAAALPTLGAAAPADVENVAAWYIARQKATKKKRGGANRAGHTVGNYENQIEFFLKFARYTEDDPRRVALGLPIGAPLRLDDPENGLSERDLLEFISLRSATNLRTRGVNERRIAKWATAAEAEERNAAAEGRDPVIAPMPELEPEVCTARTIEAAARTVKAMLSDAHQHGRSSHQPWTAYVDDEVPAAAATSYTTKLLPNRAQVQVIADAIATERRMVAGPDRNRFEGTGARYSAMVWLAGHEGPRPEETIAIRDPWVILDDGDPRIELHWAEIYETINGQRGRNRLRVPLKHRVPGEIRVIRPEPEDRDEFVRVLSEHRKKFVNTTLTGEDPYFFTNHMEEPVDLGNFGLWWRQTLETTRTTDTSPVFTNLPFRRLRAASITDWLVTLGFTTEEAATKAGNSQAMIEHHYKGVLEQRPRRAAESPSVAAATLPTMGPDLAARVGKMSDVDLARLMIAAQQEQLARLNRLAG